MTSRPHHVAPHLPWRALGALTLSLVAAAGIQHARSSSPAHPTRVAIRVECTDASACERAEAIALDVWSEERGPGLPLDVVVASDALPVLQRAGIVWTVIDADIDVTAAAEAARLRGATVTDGGDWFSEYRDYSAISAHLAKLAATSPALVHAETIGRSIEGRPIQAVRIGGTAPDAKPMLINGTQHAREWIATMVTTCIADRLVQRYAIDPTIRAFVDHTELWVVPVVNPDGYEHSWGSNRYWRKNRRGTHGVDLNRNFSVAWGGAGSSNRKGSETYRGESAFSEPETRALRDLVVREQVKVHIDFHAYGQLLLYPWNYTQKPTVDRARYASIGDRMATTMFMQHQSRYTLQSGAELYAAAGTMTDWMYETGALSFTVELRPAGRRGAGGFVIPPAQIKPTCDEGLAAVLALRAGAE